MRSASIIPTFIILLPNFSHKCNFAKHTMQELEFLDWVKRVYNHLFGTTGVACVNTNRNFIGIEQDEGYFKIAQDRINEAKQ